MPQLDKHWLLSRDCDLFNGFIAGVLRRSLFLSNGVPTALASVVPPTADTVRFAPTAAVADGDLGEKLVSWWGSMSGRVALFLVFLRF